MRTSWTTCEFMAILVCWGWRRQLFQGPPWKSKQSSEASTFETSDQKITLRVWPLKYFVPDSFFFFLHFYLCVTWWNFLCALPSVLVAGLRQYLQPTGFSLGTKSTLLKRFSSTLSDTFQSDYCPLHEYWMWMTMQGCGIYWEIQVICLTQEVMIEPKQAGETSDMLYGDGRSPEGTEIPNHKQPWGSKPVLQLATKLSHDKNSINHNPPHCNFLIPIIY